MRAMGKMKSIFNQLRLLAFIAILISISFGCTSQNTREKEIAQNDTFKAFVRAHSLIHQHYYIPIKSKRLLEYAMQGMVDASGLDLSQVGVPSSLFSFDENNKSGSKEAIPYSSIRALSQLFGRIKELKPTISDKVLLEGGIRGMVSHLDGTSEYLDVETARNLTNPPRTAGATGVLVTRQEGQIIVTHALKDSSAWKAGIESGDHIVSINNQQTKDMTLTKVVQNLRGRSGSKLNITIKKQNGLLEKLRLTREHLILQDISSKLMENGIAYIELISLNRNTSRNLLKHLNRLERENNAPLKGLIIDLRNCLGGLLDETIAVTDIFITQGKILSLEGRQASSRKEYFAGSQPAHQKWESVPIVVLTNGLVSSAGEIFASAMQDSKRATLIGSKTSGVGKIHTVFPLPDNTMLKLTTSLYKRSSGIRIDGKGVTPDICVKGNRIYKGSERTLSHCDQRFRFYNSNDKDIELNHALKILKRRKIPEFQGQHTY